MGNPSVNLEDHRFAAGVHGAGSHTRNTSIVSRYNWIYDAHNWRPPTDVNETEQFIRVQIEVAGMEESDFTIVLDGNILRISGIRTIHRERSVYHQMEIHTGEFLAEVELPGRLDFADIRAHYHDGFLVVEIPKSDITAVDGV